MLCGRSAEQGVPRSKVDEYRRRATACEESAEHAVNQIVKEQYERLARQWRVLAAQRERLDAEPRE